MMESKLTLFINEEAEFDIKDSEQFIATSRQQLSEDVIPLTQEILDALIGESAYAVELATGLGYINKTHSPIEFLIITILSQHAKYAHDLDFAIIH